MYRAFPLAFAPAEEALPSLASSVRRRRYQEGL